MSSESRHGSESALERGHPTDASILLEGGEEMQTREMTDQEFQHHALSILQRELGAEGFARFLRLYRSGRGDYTKERHRLLKGVTVDEVIEQIRSRGPGDKVKQ
jgi:hypothetical protein